MVWAIQVARLLEKIFIASTIVLVVLTVIYFSKPVEVPLQEQEDILPTQTPVVMDRDESQEKALIQQLQTQRDLFNTAAMPLNLNGMNAQPVSTTLPPFLKVVGVVIGNPSQIAIEDMNTRETYIIAKGSQDHGIELIKLERDKALVKYNGQEIMLTLGP